VQDFLRTFYLDFFSPLSWTGQPILDSSYTILYISSTTNLL
jgi:hypothetical protein